METQDKAKQFVVNVNESDKEIIGNLKKELGLGDKGLVRLLIEVALNNRNGVLVEDGATTEVDTFVVLSKQLGLVKEKKTKNVLSKEEKQKIRLEKKLAAIAAKLPPQEVSGEPETVVEIGV